MVKPIPVFAFVFAAFAATNGGQAPVSAHRRRKIGLAENDSAEPSYPQPSVVPIWRRLLERGADIYVKVGVVGNGRGKHLNLARASGSPRGDVEEIWLSNITETARVFGGVVDPSARSQIKLGRKVRFECDNVLEWTLRLSARKPDAASEAPASARLESLPQ